MKKSLPEQLKNKLFRTAGLLFCCLALAACEKDDEEPVPGTNEFLYNGKLIAVDEIYQEFYGDYYETGTHNVGLIIVSEDLSCNFYFEMFVPASSDVLLPGTYQMKDTGAQYTFLGGIVFNENEKKLADVTSGTIHISISGNTYTIKADCLLADGDKLAGNYTGISYWSDERE